MPSHKWWTAMMMSALVGVSPAHSDKLDPDRARTLVERGQILALEELLRRLGPQIEGTIVEVELERDDSGLLYEIKVLTPGGRYRKLKVDATTGALVGYD